MSLAQAKATENLRVDAERIKADILELASIGRNEEDHGIYRMAFTDADMEGKRWLRKRIEAAGLVSDMDGAANICARLPGRDGNKPYVLVGSHIDTVPAAGALDGTLGVVIGMECMRIIHERKIETKLPIELVAFSDEEGRFGEMFGSQSVAGEITPETFHRKDLDGVKLGDAMRKQGLDPLAALEARRPPEEIRSYLELHIEQGPVLDTRRIPVGIVDQITGLFKWSIRFKGQANHAGTTPMDMRNDAFMGLADFAHEIPRVLDENGSERSRATVGRAQILPGSANTVPGMVEFSLDVRDTDSAVLDELQNAFRKTLSAIARRRHLMFEFDALSRIEPVQCHQPVVKALERQAKALGMEHLVMPSGAAHDAQIMGHIVPVGMVFVPSRGGVSHSPAEWTDWADIEAGANLALHTLIQLANDE